VGDIKIILEVDAEQRTLEVPDETWRALQAIMARNGLSLEDAIAQAIANEDFIEQQTASGGKLLVARGDKLRELVFEPA
jgi:chromosomal replication initiation ATPase DnaA